MELMANASQLALAPGRNLRKIIAEILSTLNAKRLNNTRKAEIEVIFFNRATKVGSESMLELFTALGKFNDFTVDRRGLTQIVRLQMEIEEQTKIAKRITELEDGSVYISHVNWIDFESLNMPKPIYVNMIRDPVERIISWYHYIRGSYRNAIFFNKFPEKTVKPQEWFKKDFNECVRSGDAECRFVPLSMQEKVNDFRRQSLFYCGNDENCLPFNSPAAIQMAKEHVERDYAVVGSWEDTNVTLTVFEKYIPRFFQGAKMLFEIHNEKITNRNKNKRKPKIDEDVKDMIRKNFTHEYDFYNFCKQRLYKQYLAINLKTLEAHGLLD